jgi:hypothetical protein
MTFSILETFVVRRLLTLLMAFLLASVVASAGSWWLGFSWLSPLPLVV